METGSGMEAAGGCRGRGRRDGESVFNGDRVSVWEDEKVPETGQWWRPHSSVNVLNATELYT